MSIMNSTVALTIVKLGQIINPCGQPNSFLPKESIDCQAALPCINDAIQRFGLTTPEAKAVYLSTMAFESGKLSFVRNHYPSPGRLGQGTYSMMMPNNLFLFVQDNASTFSGTPIANLAIGTYSDFNVGSKITILNTLVEPKFALIPDAWWITRGANKANGCAIDMNKPHSPAQVNEFMSNCIEASSVGERTTAYNNALAVLKS